LSSCATSLDLRPLQRFFFFTHSSHPQIYTLSLHDALPICTSSKEEIGFEVSTINLVRVKWRNSQKVPVSMISPSLIIATLSQSRSEEHTSELQSRFDLVCRLLLEKKKKLLIEANSRHSKFQ